MTFDEFNLVIILEKLLQQALIPDANGIFDSGFISIYKETMQTLVEYGVMEEVADAPGRWYQARLAPSWRGRGYQGMLDLMDKVTK